MRAEINFSPKLHNLNFHYFSFKICNFKDNLMILYSKITNSVKIYSAFLKFKLLIKKSQKLRIGSGLWVNTSKYH